MTRSTIEKRLQRRFIVMSTDADMIETLRAQVPVGWEMVVATDLDELGGWGEILLFRFLLLDLDEIDAFDPLDVIRAIRTEHMLQIAVFCFGGDSELRDEMRLARADRFFDRAEMAAVLPQFLNQYSW